MIYYYYYYIQNTPYAPARKLRSEDMCLLNVPSIAGCNDLVEGVSVELLQ